MYTLKLFVLLIALTAVFHQHLLVGKQVALSQRLVCQLK